MTIIDDFKYVITLWKGFEIPDIIERDVNIDLNANKVITIAGVRRSGKTHVMFQCMNILLKKGIKRDNIFYVDFENERLVGIRATDLDNLLIAHRELFNPNGIVYVFLDEIQVVENWEKWVRKIYDTGGYRLIITGSSSELLSREIATSLAGRNLTYVIYPFSFEEYVNARNMQVSKLTKYSIDKGTILKAVNEFLEFRSFPEVALTQDESRKLELLSSYFDAIFFKDIVRRYKVREVGELKVFLRIISSNYAAYFSSVKSFNYFQSLGMKISRVTVLKFLEYTQSVFLVSLLEQYQKSVRKRTTRQTKAYVIDIGVSRLFSDIDKGRSLENAVFLELMGRKRPLDSIAYLRLKSGKEVDFIVGGKTIELIQVSYDVSAPGTRPREISGLVEAATKLGLRKGTVITYDYEKKETVEGISIEYVPFWIWAVPSMH